MGAVFNRAMVRRFSMHATVTVPGWLTFMGLLAHASAPVALLPCCTTVPAARTETDVTSAVPEGSMRGLLICGRAGGVMVDPGDAGGVGGAGAHAAVALLENVTSACAGDS